MNYLTSSVKNDAFPQITRARILNPAVRQQMWAVVLLRGFDCRCFKKFRYYIIKVQEERNNPLYQAEKTIAELIQDSGQSRATIYRDVK